MIYPKPKNEAEKTTLHRKAYELEKEDLTKIHAENGYETPLKDFLVNSLKYDYETELKEDGLM